MGVETLLAHEAIRQVLYRYCRGVDRGDAGLLEDVYHADAVDVHGAFKGNGHEFATHIVANLDAVDGVAQHHITNVLIDLAADGDSAQVESYFLAFHPYAEGEAERVAYVGGRYLDRFEARDGAWRIAHREVVLDWAKADLSGDDWPAVTNFSRGARRDADPSARYADTHRK